MNITIQCFGIFRLLGERIELAIKEGSTIADMRIVLSDRLDQSDATFADAALLASSHFATESDVLPDDARLKDGMCLAIIPPVSGG